MFPKGEIMKKTFAAGLAAFSLAFTAVAPAHADAREDAQAISEVLAADEILDTTFNLMSDMFIQSIRGAFAQSNVPLSNETADTFANIMIDELAAVLGAEMVDMQTELLLVQFSAEELSDVRAFLETDSGRAFIAGQANMMGEAAVRGEQIAAAAMPSILQNVLTRLEGPEGEHLPETELVRLLSLMQ